MTPQFPRLSSRAHIDPTPGQVGFDFGDGGGTFVVEPQLEEVRLPVAAVPEWARDRDARLLSALDSLRLRNRSLGSASMSPGGRNARGLRHYEGGHSGVVDRVDVSDGAFRMHLEAACGACALSDSCRLASDPGAFDRSDTFHYASAQNALRAAIKVDPTVNCSTIVTERK